MKKKFTVQDILDFNPCSKYTEEKITQLFKSVGCKKYVTIDKLFEANIPHEDFLWLILRPEFIPEKQLHEIAIWCAEKIAMPIWEKYYPDDKRPQNAIKVKKAWLKGKATSEELATAWAAGEAAARAAMWGAAWAAGEAAARAAVWGAAGAAGEAAARAAVWGAAWAAGEAAVRAAVWAVGEAAWGKIKNHIAEVIKNQKEDNINGI